MKLKPMMIILVGSITAIVGGVITAVGTFMQNSASSAKMANLKNTSDQINLRSEAQLKEIENLKNQTRSLSEQVDTLNVLVIDQGKANTDLSKENAELVKKLSEKTNSFITGGDAYPILIISPINNSAASLAIFNRGDFPLYDVFVEIVDTDLFQKLIEGITGEIPLDVIQRTRTKISIPTLHPNGSAQLDRFVKADFSKEIISFSIFLSSRNGLCIQQTRIYNNGKSRAAAIRITREKDSKILLEETDPTFPKSLLKWD